MTSELAKAGFGIKINYGRNSSPARVFRALSDMINSLQEMDRHILKSVDIDIEPLILLENIEQGSVIVWLIDVLESLDENDVKDLNLKKIFGTFLNKTRYAIINFTRKNNRLETKEQVKELQDEIIKIAEQSEIKKLPIYSPIDPRNLLSSISDLQSSLVNLGEDDEVSYLTSESEISFNKEFSFSNEVAEDILTKETIETPSVMLLKVKKPDYLGDSKWEFKYENKKLEAKIKNVSWLSDYQKGKIDIRPGSSLRVLMNIVVKYDYDNEVISTQYEILEVIDVIPPVTYIQGELAD